MKGAGLYAVRQAHTTSDNTCNGLNKYSILTFNRGSDRHKWALRDDPMVGLGTNFAASLVRTQPKTQIKLRPSFTNVSKRFAQMRRRRSLKLITDRIRIFLIMKSQWEKVCKARVSTRHIKRLKFADVTDHQLISQQPLCLCESAACGVVSSNG